MTDEKKKDDKDRKKLSDEELEDVAGGGRARGGNDAGQHGAAATKYCSNCGRAFHTADECPKK